MGSFVIRVSVQGMRAEERALAPGSAYLVGRRPDVSRLPATRGARWQQVSPWEFASDVVSEQHCLVWADAERVWLRDLRSTNGTTVRLPTDGELATTSGTLTVTLSASDATGEAIPVVDAWSDDADYRARVCAALESWLERSAIAAQVHVRAPEALGSLFEFPIGSGACVVLTAAGAGSTTDVRLRRALPALWAFANGCRGRYEADREGAAHHDDLVLESPALRRVHQQIVEAARRGLNGIIQGESGVGKSALARCFHIHSARRDGPFVETNVAEDSDDRKYFQLKLFGARAGASVGLVRDQSGLVQVAHRGTLFLDEVGTLPLEVQGMLLRFLDRGTYRRLGDPGDAGERHADVRVVVGTNLDLREAVRRGTFREDLWWRLSGLVVEVPPLRERPEDIAAVLQREVLESAGEARSVLDALTPEARHHLLRVYPWPGNFRELRNLLARLPMFAPDGQSVSLSQCATALAAGSIAPPMRRSEPAADPGTDDLLPRARDLARRRAALEGRGEPTFREVYEDVLRPLCIARALGLEHWTEVPRRVDPSYRAMAASLGYADGRSIQAAMAAYVELARLARDDEARGGPAR